MAKLASNVHVKDPRTHQMVQLEAGSEPEPELAALVPNPDAWEGGKPPTAAKKTVASDSSTDGDDGDGDKQAAKKTAAKRPARGRSAADQGDSSD